MVLIFSKKRILLESKSVYEMVMMS